MNSIPLKTQAELDIQHKAGQLLAQVFLMLDELVKPGLSTMQINDAVEAFIRGPLGARPASKGQYDYQYVLNSSINEVVCHGMPKQTDILKEGDIVNLDITLEKDGFIADSSKMYCIGKVSPLAQKLVDVTYQALWQGIYQVKPGARLGDIAAAVQQYAERFGYSVVREYCGHGIGREMHEEPQILHYGKPGTGLTLKPGMVFTIEPMINQGDRRIKQKTDGWTVVTKDKKLSAQWEHTIAVTETGFSVLTLRPEEHHLLQRVSV